MSRKAIVAVAGCALMLAGWACNTPDESGGAASAAAQGGASGTMMSAGGAAGAGTSGSSGAGTSGSGGAGSGGAAGMAVNPGTGGTTANLMAGSGGTGVGGEAGTMPIDPGDFDYADEAVMLTETLTSRGETGASGRARVHGQRGREGANQRHARRGRLRRLEGEVPGRGHAALVGRHRDRERWRAADDARRDRRRYLRHPRRGRLVLHGRLRRDRHELQGCGAVRRRFVRPHQVPRLGRRHVLAGKRGLGRRRERFAHDHRCLADHLELELRQQLTAGRHDHASAARRAGVRSQVSWSARTAAFTPTAARATVPS